MTRHLSQEEVPAVLCGDFFSIARRPEDDYGTRKRSAVLRVSEFQPTFYGDDLAPDGVIMEPVGVGSCRHKTDNGGSIA